MGEGRMGEGGMGEGPVALLHITLLNLKNQTGRWGWVRGGQRQGLGGMKEGLGVKRTDQREPSHHLFGPLLAL